MIPYLDIYDQFLDIIVYYYSLLHPNIIVNEKGIQHLSCIMKYYFYPHKYVNDVEIMYFPYEKMYTLEGCVIKTQSQYRIRNDILDDMKHIVEKYFSHVRTISNTDFRYIISLSPSPIEVYYWLDHNYISSILNLYNY